MVVKGTFIFRGIVRSLFARLSWYILHRDILHRSAELLEIDALVTKVEPDKISEEFFPDFTLAFLNV